MISANGILTAMWVYSVLARIEVKQVFVQSNNKLANGAMMECLVLTGPDATLTDVFRCTQCRPRMLSIVITNQSYVCLTSLRIQVWAGRVCRAHSSINPL